MFRKAGRSDASTDTISKDEELNLAEVKIAEATDQSEKTNMELETKVQRLQANYLQLHLTSSKLGE
jgi:uncharacterized lipoprotein YmbA